MPTTTTPRPTAPSRLHATRLSRRVAGRTLLDDVTLGLAPGELVAIIGGSGAGKTTLLESLGGIRRPSSGRVRIDGRDVADGVAGVVGFVPQDDIIHLDLPLRRTLLYAARLRMPSGAADVDRELAVERVLEELDLSERGDVRVRDLSGGQRKRASIAVELLTAPSVLLLDEPTSGLDPATAAEVLAVLRRLADHGTTVVLTTHAPADVRRCDRVVALARGGGLVYDGAPAAAPARFAVADLEDVYAVLAAADRVTIEGWRAAARTAAGAPAVDSPPEVGPGPAATGPRAGAGFLQQLLTLTRRSADLMAANRLTATILFGAPALVIAMLAMLFRPGAFAPAAADPVGAVQLVYWIAFAGFFFGLTYGLLQIVLEVPILRREASGGLSVAAYVASKVMVLLPLLVTVDVAMLTLLRALDRLPDTDPATWAGLAVTFLLDAAAGLALGLLTSATVTSAAQATLALPMLCFPQVLFAGAMVPVPVMPAGGRAVSEIMSNRWAFEALGRLLDLEVRFPGEPGALGAWAPAFEGSAADPVTALGVMTVLCIVGTVLTLRRRTAPR